MSTEAIVVTIAAAFVGGGCGAFVGPIVSHKLGRSVTRAEHRREPYRRILDAAREMKATAGTRPIGPFASSIPEVAQKWSTAADAYKAAIDAADLDTSKETRALCAAFLAAMNVWIHVGGQIAELDASKDDAWEIVQPLVQAVEQAQSAYDALREQMRHEIEG